MRKEFFLSLAMLLPCISLAAEPVPETNKLALLGDSVSTPLSLQPKAIIRLDPSEPYVVIASLSEATLNVFENINGFLQQKMQLPISIGKQGFGKQKEGDKKTPIGVYRITSYLGDEQLDAFYGHAAYPLDYPNIWDKRMKRTGSGIWLHAMPEGVSSRPTYDSDGCVVVNNEAIAMLAPFLNVGRTKVVLTEKMNWAEVESQTALQDQISAQINSWRRAWQSLYIDNYMSYYSEDFTSGDYTFESWREYKDRVNKSKEFIIVNISQLGLFAYPGEGNIVMAEFYQEYESSNFTSQGWKRQLWQKEDEGWKIIYEAGG